MQKTFEEKLHKAVLTKSMSPRTRDEYLAIAGKLFDGKITTDSIPSKPRFLQIAAVIRKLQITGIIGKEEFFGLNMPELKDKFKKHETDNHKVSRIEHKYLTRAMFDMFLAAIPNTAAGDQLRRAASLSYGCGARMEEVLNFTRADFDVQADVIVVTIRNGKGGKPRKTYMSRDFLHMVETFTPFTISRESLNTGSVRAFKRAGLHTSFHALRHSFATDAARNGVPILELAAMLGHTDPKTTALYYHVEEKASQAILSFLNKR